MKSIRYSIVVFIWSIAVLPGCSDERDTPVISGQQEEIQRFVNEGSLLKEAAKQEGSYLLTFENGSVSLPAGTVRSIDMDRAQWKTLLVLADNNEISIPTLGNDINGAVISVKPNPSGFNPLAAEVFAAFPVKGRARIIVHGKEGSHGTVEYLFKEYSENHNLTVLGLYAGYDNRVSIVMTDKDGNERARTELTLPTQPLQIAALPAYIKVKQVRFDKLEPGMTMLNDPGASEADTSCPYMLDADGEIRWVLDWRTSPDLLHVGAQCGLHRLDNGHYLVGDANNGQVAEVDVLGKVVRKWDLQSVGYNFHHDALMDGNGKLLITATKLDAVLASGKPRIYDYIIEMSADGTVDRTWDLTALLDSARYAATDPSLPGAAFGQTQGNWAHNNAVLPWGDDYLASARFQGVFKFNRSGELAWVIAPHKNWRPEYRKYLLTPLDKDGNVVTDPQVVSGEKSSEAFDWPWGQHTPVIMPNGHILVFDNGYGRNFVTKLFTEPGQYSRAVEYEVDETNRTVGQVWEYGRDRADCYAAAMSSVQYLPITKHILFCPGMGNRLSDGSFGGHVIEVDPLTKEVVFEMEICTNFHRATRISLYPEGM